MTVAEPSPVAVASPAPTKPAPSRDEAVLPAIVETGGAEGGTGSDNDNGVA